MEGVHRLGIRGDEGYVERAGRLPLDERQVLGVRRPQDHAGSPRLRRSGYVGHLGPQRLQGRPVELQGAREVGDPDDYVIDKGGRAGHRRTVLPGRLRVKRETHAWGAPISTRPRRASYKPLERSSENAVHPKFAKFAE